MLIYLQLTIECPIITTDFGRFTAGYNCNTLLIHRMMKSCWSLRVPPYKADSSPLKSIVKKSK